MKNYSRKEFISTFIKGAGCFAVAASVPFYSATSKEANQFSDRQFPQGIASGDPTPGSIVLWTRAVDYKNDAGQDIHLVLQVSEQSSFDRLVAEKKCTAADDTDYTVRVIVYDLQPDTRYYYRFVTTDGLTSLTGRTSTAPKAKHDKKVKIAIACCQSFEGGYYNAYRALIERDKKAADSEKIDFLLHLGDFIYETKGYGNTRELPDFPSGGAKLGDDVEWAKKYAVTLDDYRHLYKTYLQDPDLKEARARWPFIITWDDHEFTDDSWQSMSTYEVPNTPEQKRKVAANQAWFEYIPAFLTGLEKEIGTNQPASDFEPVNVENKSLENFDKYGLVQEPNNLKAVKSITIYRSLKWGEHVDLFITDTRSYRTQHPVPGEIALKISGNARYIAPLPLVKISDAGRTFNGGNAMDSIAIGKDKIPNLRKNSPKGTILGQRQKKWLKEGLKNSKATWSILATSVPMMPTRLDLQSVNPDAQDVIFSTDTWEGYLSERKEILQFFKNLGRTNLIAISGDNHNNFAGVLKDDFEQNDASVLGVEFSVCGISSTSVFQALENVVEKDSDLRPLITYDATKFGGKNEKVENLNVSFLWGAEAAVTAAKTNNIEKAKAKENTNHNPHLRYVDSAAKGIGVITVDKEKVTGELITVKTTDKIPTNKNVQVLREAKMEYKTEYGDLKLMKVEGMPPHPLA